MCFYIRSQTGTFGITSIEVRSLVERDSLRYEREERPTLASRLIAGLIRKTPVSRQRSDI